MKEMIIKTAAEMKLENERLRMTVNELEKSDNAVGKIVDMLDNTIQINEDRIVKSDDFFERVRLSNRNVGLRKFRAELTLTFREEEPICRQ